MSRPVAGFISFRLGGGDGVSVEAAKWQAAFGILGFDVLTVAGEGSADRLIPALGIRASEPPSAAEVTDALAPADLVVVENLMSLPLNPGASAVVASVLRDRATLVRHHDLPWQREQFENHPPPPDSPRWRHVVINQISRRQLAAHRIESTVMRNTFDVDQPPGDRKRGRAEIDVDESELLVLQPTRAIPRKNVAGGLALTAELGGVFWLLGPPEDGFGPEVEALVSTARCRVIRGNAPGSDSRAMTDVYAASDVVALPSTWEGFGNPAVESAVHRRPLAIGSYPVAAELAAFGFRWFNSADPRPIRSWLEHPRSSLLERNHAVARTYFSSRTLPNRLGRVLDSPGWLLS